MSEDLGWKQVRNVIEQADFSKGKIELGTLTNYEIMTDIKHLGMRFSRYKFIAKLMMYESSVRALELGCSEAWGGLMMKQNLHLEKWTGLDFDRDAMSWNRKFLPDEFEFIECDFLNYSAKCKNAYNLVYSVDVIEHIEPEMEEAFCKTIIDNLSFDGTAIIGTPSIGMTPYASESARQDHINLYDQRRLFASMKKYFNNVYIFNMNDEIVHTGFAPMTCYIFAVCSNPKGKCYDN